MPHIIAEPCIGTKDTSCVEVCPVDCIHPTKDDPDFESSEMLYIDPDTCIDCGLCVEECPVDCIQPRDGYEDVTGKMLYIDPETCIDCGACEPVCPVNAIYPEADVPEDQQKYIALNYEHFGQEPP